MYQFALALEELGHSSSESEAKKNVVAAVKAVAAKLGNRPSTSRKYYIHPAVIDAYVDGSLISGLKEITGERREETCVIKLVEKYVAQLNLER